MDAYDENEILLAKEEALDYEGVRLLTVEEVSEKKRCTAETVRRAVRAGEFPSARKVGSVWLLDAREVATWKPRPVGRPAQAE